MPRFAANLSMMFTEHPFLERFQQAAQAGFEAVEFWFPYAHAPEDIAVRLAQNNLELALFNAPPGDWEAGERGLAALHGREAEFERAMVTALDYAAALGCAKLHVMAGCAIGAAARQCYVANLRRAAAMAREANVTLMIEPINLNDAPGYHLHLIRDALRVIKAVNAPNLRLQLDLYHAQISEGGLSARLRGLTEHIGHIQIAGAPERHEPDRGEINYPYLFDLIDASGYEGYIGCEYRPYGETNAGLGWFAPYARRAPVIEVALS